LSTAISLAREGYGKTLLDGISRSQSTTDVAAFLVVWRKTLIQELQTNQSGSLHKRLPVLAASVPLNFPDPYYINLYLNPVTSEHEQHKGAVAIIAEQGPDLVRLALFVEEHFVWGDFAGILKRFSSCVFPGLALRELLSAVRDIDRGIRPKPLSMIGKIHGQRKPSKASAHRALEVRASLVVSRSTIEAIRDGLVGTWDTPMTRTTSTVVMSKWLDDALPGLRLWIPLAIHSFVLPIELSSLAVVEDEPGMCVPNYFTSGKILIVPSQLSRSTRSQELKVCFIYIIFHMILMYDHQLVSGERHLKLLPLHLRSLAMNSWSFLQIRKRGIDTVQVVNMEHRPLVSLLPTTFPFLLYLYY
jgi:hypothetical protein